MKHTSFLIPIALLASFAVRAQPSSQQPATPPAVGGPNSKSLDDDPAFKKLSPEQQAWVRQMTERLDKAIADKDSAAIDQLAKEVADHQQATTEPLRYHYATQDNSQTPTPKPPTPATSPCVVAPKKQGGILGKLKDHAKHTIEGQAAKADARLGKATKRNVDGGVLDTTHTVITEADQPAPCPPAKAPNK
jgi:hypothetical protein